MTRFSGFFIHKYLPIVLTCFAKKFWHMSIWRIGEIWTILDEENFLSISIMVDTHTHKLYHTIFAIPQQFLFQIETIQKKPFQSEFSIKPNVFNPLRLAYRNNYFYSLYSWIFGRGIGSNWNELHRGNL